MKNLMIWINPSKWFDKEASSLIKIQIENSLDLGWKKEDIILVTNFNYEYMGVFAHQISGEHYCKLFKQATKVDVMVYLFDTGFIGDSLYWVHDLDAYQNEIFTEKELGLDSIDLGMTDYGRHDRWNGGSTFFRNGANRFYHEIKKVLYRDIHLHKEWLSEEDVIVQLTKENFDNINSRIKRLNISYNFGIKQMKKCYEKALKPIRVLHFHPERRYRTYGRAFNIVATDRNELGHLIMSERLITLFNKYGYTTTN